MDRELVCLCSLSKTMNMSNIVQRFSHSIVGCLFPCLCFGKGRLVVLKHETDRKYRGKRPQNHYGYNRPPFFTLSVRPAMCRSRHPKCGLQFSKHVVLLKIPLKFFTILHLPRLFGREKEVISTFGPSNTINNIHNRLENPWSTTGGRSLKAVFTLAMKPYRFPPYFIVNVFSCNSWNDFKSKSFNLGDFQGCRSKFLYNPSVRCALGLTSWCRPFPPSNWIFVDTLSCIITDRTTGTCFRPSYQALHILS